ncbi:hypothetical protein GM50_15910 [freshwater metagenome]|uniref:Uncharacterized protein n=1 Tax=freshwater metagenome TaxID=449393 RepID=A0A094Q1K4_9ZZZZ
MKRSDKPGEGFESLTTHLDIGGDHDLVVL